MAQFIDYPSIQDRVSVATEDTENVAVSSDDALVIPFVVPEQDVATLLSEYDSSSSSSPNAANSRVIARLIMDAIVRAKT
jgi:hypothetical protein|tara:strand:+ start:133 stop:372 length:240 start_codon:yes stop_codon:yes gene_type:complete